MAGRRRVRWSFPTGIGCQPSEGGTRPSLGFQDSSSTAFEGQLSAVAADRLDIETSGGIETFAWVGPTLVDHFAVGDDVEVSIAIPPMRAGWVSVTSATSVAVVVDGSDWTMSSTMLGATYTVAVPAGLPRKGTSAARNSWPRASAPTSKLGHALAWVELAG